METGVKLIVQKNGGVSIGTNASAMTPDNGLYVHGNIVYNGTLSHSSDVRFKQHITPLLKSLDGITRLRGVRYYWNKQAFPQREFTAESQIGLIAQEVELIYPELVQTSPDGFKSIDYVKLTPILLEAIKELHSNNVQLEKRLEQIETFLQISKTE